MHKSKLYVAQLAKFNPQDRYEIAAALEVLKSMPHVKFDETVEMAMKLGIDPKKSDQNVRGAVALPAGTGKAVRVAVVADGAQAEDAKTAGADVVGYEDVVQRIKDGWQEFDVLIATPDAMKLVRPLGRQLGPRGLMPNPKTGTVTEQIGAAVREAKAGRVEFRADKGGCIHAPIGKLSFDVAGLIQNFNAVFEAVLKAKPATAKGQYLLSCTVTSTMSPGVKVIVREQARAK